MDTHSEGTRQEHVLPGRDMVVDARIEGTRQEHGLRGHDIVVDTHFKGNVMLYVDFKLYCFQRPALCSKRLFQTHRSLTSTSSGWKARR